MKLANNEKLTSLPPPPTGKLENKMRETVTMTRRSKQLKPSNGSPFYGKQNGHFEGRETVPHHR